MNIQNIADRITLVTLTLGKWNATRQNRTESLRVNLSHQTGDAAKVLVRLSNHPALGRITKLHNEAYAEHRRLTLPSCQDGVRILPARRQFDHSTAMQSYSRLIDAEVAAFSADYDSERSSAPARLNGLFDPNQWPTRSTVEARFVFATRYLPCPISGTWQDWLEETATTAETELRDRLVSAVTHVAARVAAAKDGKLYQSVFDNVKQICELVPDLNIMDNPGLKKLAEDAEKLGRLTAEHVKHSPVTQNNTLADVNRMLQAFGSPSQIAPAALAATEPELFKAAL